MPSVQIYYAVKTCPNNEVIRELKNQGCNFDCASANEIKQVLELGVSPDRIIFANPCKGDAHLRYAKQVGVEYMTLDCVEELENIHSIYPEAKLVMRIAVENTDAPAPMGKKFGSISPNWEGVVKRCAELKMNLKGVSFHVGTGGCSFNAYKESLENT